MQIVRTDLAMEAKEAAGEISGVAMEQQHVEKAIVTRVNVMNELGARAIGKPIGTYVTIEQRDLYEKHANIPDTLVQCIAKEITALIGREKRRNVLVVGLGNRDLTPDSLGPRVAQEILVSRHILMQMPEVLDERVQSVCVFTPGVMGSTGLETGEIVQSVVRSIQPDCVIVVDALAARSTERILSTIQITDAGVAPGSGVGNHRDALTKETLGIPVIAVGVPMVVQASTILRDALEHIAGDKAADLNLHALVRSMDGENLVVTPVMIDEAVRNVASLVAEGINMALQPKLSRAEIAAMRI